MSFDELLFYLRQNNVNLWVEGDRLRYQGSKQVMTPEMLAQIRKHKMEIITFLGKADAYRESSLPEIGTELRSTENLPLSFAQESLWFLHQLQPENVSDHLYVGFRINGPLQIDMLKRSLKEIVKRHEILRTTFPVADGKPVQIITSQLHFNISEIDLSNFTGSEKAGEARRLAIAEAQKPFEFESEPLLRVKLLILGKDEYLSLVTMHHIISDGFSFDILFSELSALYEAYTSGKACPLEDLSIQYADYACWQRQWMQGKTLEAQISYWKQKLSGSSFVLELPTDRPRPTAQSFQGTRRFFSISKPLYEALKVLGQKESCTLFMTLAATFQVLLYKYTNQEDIIIGVPSANRNRPELEKLIGLFLNMIVLRTDLSGNPSFLELLGRVRQGTLEALAHQDLPFEKLVEALQPDRDLSRNPLFQIMMEVLPVENLELKMKGFDIKPLEIDIGAAQFDLSLHLFEGAKGLRGFFEYNTDLFDAERIERMVRHFQTLLEAIVADPGKCIGDLPIIDEAERRQLLVEWNDTVVEYPRDKCLHQLFEAQVERTPDAVAVIFGQQRLTYRELNTRANKLAHYLRLQGVVAESRVGIWMDRSLDMMVALLGTLKAGGAYVPLDPSYPQERLAFMLEDAQAPVLLTREKFLEDLAAYVGHVVCLDKDVEAIADGSEENTISGITPDSAAYVIYTSGSAGTPKGVIGLHRGAVNRLSWMWRVYPFKDGEVGCQKTYLSFLDSVWEIFGPLLKGVPAVIIPEEVVKDPHLLVNSLAAAHVSRIVLVPSLLRMLLDSFDDLQKRLLDLKIWVTSGEEISVELAQRFGQVMPEAKLINLYGSSEVSADVSCYEVADGRQDRCIPIGRPIDNTSVYILDSHLQPVPIGVPGELYIGGVGVAQGYLDQPDLTAERFIPSPFGQKEILFKTGDLGRYLADGNIEYLGRIDHQVKVRGFRIELGEIESQLKCLEAVGNCVVVLREDRPGDQRLTAYYVCKDGQTVAESEVRRQLQAKLPDYMVPQHFVELSSIPLTPSGKVDRRSLPAPDVVRPKLEEDFVAPRNQSEELVAGIWSNVLELERIGIHDNFFALGGHSLLVVQIVSRIREVFEVELAVRALFEAPTVVGLTERIEAARRSDEGLQISPLQAVSRDQDLPLSFAQERLWFLHHYEPDSAAYSMPNSIRLKGVLRKDALQKTYVELARRHETLRTTFHSSNGNPVLRIAAEPDIVFDTIDLRHLPEAEREAEARRLSAEDARKPFDLGRGPLLRIRLFQLEDEEHVLHFNMHHSISDFWSSGVMAREIAAYYTAFIEDEPADLPELPVQYADYAVWQRQWLQGETLEALLTYWKDKLGGELPVLELPTDRPRPAVQTHRGAIESLVLPKDLTDALQALSRREGVTLFMTLLAAFKTLLCRLTGQEDTIVGTAIAGRNRTELEGLIGFFVNTIVMRTDLAGQPSFRELLGRVRETALGAYANQDIPFEKLLEELAPERDLSRPPLFQVFFNHLVARGDRAMQLPGLAAEAVGGFDPESKFDMTLFVLEGEGGIWLRSVYNTDLFDSWRMAQMLKQYQMLLESIVSDPDQRISHLSILNSAERHRILVDWNATQQDYASEKTLVQLFEEQVARSPDAIAVVYEDQNLTYKELNQRANQLACHLSSLGVGPETVVGICVGRSFEMVVGILGILKAGGAYLPLDPEYPKERLQYMVTDSGADMILTSRRLTDFVKSLGDLSLITLDGSDISHEGLDDNDKVPKIVIRPGNLAYVIYTSGSTGLPKGTLIEHKSLVNYLCWVNTQLMADVAVRLPLITKLTFDACLKQLLAPLLRGDEVLIFPDDLVAQPARLLQALSAYDQIGLNCTPALWKAIIDELSNNPDMLPMENLSHLFIGGEQLSPDLINRSFATLSHLEIWNLYGPSEATANSSAARIVAQGEVTIGRPVANTRIYILDPYLQVTPIGVPGELHLGGEGLARGYLNRPDLTAERFIANPFSDKPGTRLYKTGDLVRYLPDGNIEYLGRLDNQVKIRGFRIELGEIETTLCLHPSVSEAVVVAREDRPEDKRLVAYVVAAAAESAPATGVLRAFLQEKLPDYMIPSAFVPLDAIPLTAIGKVDRRALPAPDVVRPDLEEAFVAPRSQSEELVAGIWSKVLGLERIGVYDSFFELGGHSLLVVQIISRIREVFEVELPVRALFEAPTVAGLTERIETARRSDEGMQLYPLQAVSRDQDLPLSFAQERLWFLHQLEPDSAAYSMPSSIRLKGVLRKDALQKTYVELARRHETLRTTFHSNDGNPVLDIAAEPNIVFDTVDLRHLPEVEREAEARRLGEEDARKPFDLSRGPLFRIRLFQLEDEEHVLHSNMHHIISDGWSSDVMAREIAALYSAFIEGKSADLPELPVQYADYALWQRQWLQGEALEAQLSYWKDKLGGELPVLELPTDRPRPAVQTHRAAIESLALPKELTEALQAMSQQEGVTLFMTLLAAFKTLLYRHTGQEDVIVGTPIAGRNRTELEGLIGFFMNTIVMRTDLSGQPSFRELLGRVRETALGAYAHQDMPFERLVEELAPERDLSRTPLFQVFFNHIVAMGDKAAKLPGLEAEAVGGLENRESKFDMTLYVFEGEGGIKLSLVYNTDLFDASAITWMLAHFEALLEGIADDPDQCISALPLLTGTTRQKLSTKGNTIQPTKSFANIKSAEIDQSLQGRFMQQVKLYPDNIAVKTRKYEWTYQELNLEANRIAKRVLTECGDKEERIALLFGHDAPMIASLFGALVAGKTYVPLDPSYPVERLAYILEDSNACAVLTDSINVDLAQALTRKKVQLINIDDKQYAQSFDNVEVSITPDALAYILYTSGSTGLPKGVMQNHRNVMHFIRVYTNNLHISEDDRLSLISSYSFDGAIMDIFGALLNGSTLYPINIKDETSESILQWLIDQKITLYHSTPTVYRYLLGSLDIQKKFPKIRLVVLGGEEVFRHDVELYQKHFEPDCIFINGLGPSESTVTIQYLINGHTEISRTAVPVGYPVEETEILLFNEAGEEAEVYGEISIRSPHIALGYWQKPELTNKVFLPDPEGGDKRIYRSGDMGRLLPDGSIEFVGRKDFQVKIRGFRIEVGEIEVVLGQHPAIGEVVVVPGEDSHGARHLVAYLVTNETSYPSISEIRSFLKQKLPDYMIPSAFVFLDAMPLTANGKVDRQALPKPEEDGASEQGYVAPRTETEQRIAAVWQEVLNREQVGVNDDFFELGGHSLLATQVMSRIIKLFNIQLPLRRFFEATTIEALAEVIDISLWNSQGLQKSGITGNEEREVIEL